MSLGLFQSLEFLGSSQSVDIRHITLFYNFVSYWQYYTRGGPTLPDKADILFLLPDVQTRFNMVQSEPVILETPTSTMAFSVRLARSCPLQEAFLALLMLQISDRTDLDQVFRLKFLLPSQRPGASKSEILLKQPWGRIFALNRHYFFPMRIWKMRECLHLWNLFSNKMEGLVILWFHQQPVQPKI